MPSQPTIVTADTPYLTWLAPEGKVFGTFVRQYDDDVLLGLADTAGAAIALAATEEPDHTLTWEAIPSGLIASAQDLTYTVKMLPVRRDPRGIRSPLTPVR